MMSSRPQVKILCSTLSPEQLRIPPEHSYRPRRLSYVLLGLVLEASCLVVLANGAEVGSLVSRASDRSLSFPERQDAYQRILALNQDHKHQALRELIRSGDNRFCGSAAVCLLENGEVGDQALIARELSEWSMQDQLVVLQALPLVPSEKDSRVIARKVLEVAETDLLSNEYLRALPNPLNVAAMRLRRGASKSDLELLSRIARRYPQLHGVWLAIGIEGADVSLESIADKVRSDDRAPIEVRVAAGLTLPEESQGYQWAKTTVLDFIRRHKDVMFGSVQLPAEHREAHKEFSKHIRLLALLRLLKGADAESQTTQMLEAENAVIRLAAAIAIIFRWPTTFLEVDRSIFDVRSYENLLGVLVVIHPSMRSQVETEIGDALDDAVERVRESSNLALFGIVGGIIGGN